MWRAYVCFVYLQTYFRILVYADWDGPMYIFSILCKFYKVTTLWEVIYYVYLNYSGYEVNISELCCPTITKQEINYNFITTICHSNLMSKSVAMDTKHNNIIKSFITIPCGYKHVRFINYFIHESAALSASLKFRLCGV